MPKRGRSSAGTRKKKSPKEVSFSEKLQNLPEEGQFVEHIWVDYLELMCLVNNDGELSKADAQERIKRRVDDLKEGGQDLQEPGEETAAERTDSWSSKVADWFRQLEYRQQTFGSFYPFQVIENGSVLLRRPDMTVRHKLYLSLLFSSNLRYIGRKHHALTSSFEVISYEIMKRCLPEKAEVHIYGTSPLRPPHRYQGNLWQKINKLASDINEKVLAPESDFAPTNTGDGGLDIVGWVPCGDSASSLLLLFGQSACTSDWVRKQASSSPEAWRGKMTFKSMPQNMVFIPFCLRNADGTWHVGSTIQSILMDRQRITYFLEQEMTFFTDLPSHSFVEEVLRFRQGVV